MTVWWLVVAVPAGLVGALRLRARNRAERR